MGKHMWVSFQYTPVVIEEQSDGSLKVEAELEAVEVAEEQAVIGCWFCHTNLTTESYNTECALDDSPQNF